MAKQIERTISAGSKDGKAFDVAKRIVELGLATEVAREYKIWGTLVTYKGENFEAALYDARLGIPELKVTADERVYKELRKKLKLDRSGKLTD